MTKMDFDFLSGSALCERQVLLVPLGALRFSAECDGHFRYHPYSDSVC